MTSLEPLCKHVERIRFKTSALNTLQTFLAKPENVCSYHSVDKHVLLMLNSEFKTIAENKKITQPAFKKICDFIGPSLFKTIRHIAKFSVPEAAVMFSMAVKASFSRCLNDKTVKIVDDSIVSIAQTYDESNTNKKFYDSVEAVVNSHSKNFHLQEACVYGDSLSICVQYSFDSLLNKKLIDDRMTPVAYRLQLSNTEGYAEPICDKAIVQFGSLGQAWTKLPSQVDLKTRLFYGLNLMKLFDSKLANLLPAIAEKSLGLTGDKSRDTFALKTVKARLMASGLDNKESSSVIRRALNSAFIDDKFVLSRTRIFSEKTFLEIFIAMLIEQAETYKTAKSRNRLARAIWNSVNESEDSRG
jgi:hypothetical protein